MKATEIGVIFQIPKFEAEVELFLADGRCISGRLFLPILTSNPLGHTPLLDWMNEQADFFPFLPDKSKEAEILSKQAVVQAVIDTKLDQDEIEEMMEETVWIEQIEVRCEPFVTLTGSVLLNLPSGRSRVLDFLNQLTKFFAIKNGSKSHIINKKFVTWVKELPSLPVPEPAPETTHARAKRSSRASKNSNYRRTGKK